VVGQDVLLQPLRQVALFEGLTPEQLSAIARTAERIVFKPGDSIVEDGQDTGAAIIVVSGAAERIGYGDRPDPIEPGSMLSEMAMFVDTEATATIVARSAVRALRIDRSAMLEQMVADPSLADHFVARIAGRLKDIANELRRVDRSLAGDRPVDVSWTDVNRSTGHDARH
jgi:CRP-like cAMP-binding protein